LTQQGRLRYHSKLLTYINKRIPITSLRQTNCLTTRDTAVSDFLPMFVCIGGILPIVTAGDEVGGLFLIFVAAFDVEGTEDEASWGIPVALVNCVSVSNSFACHYISLRFL
jgi:hypothetical protein